MLRLLGIVGGSTYPIGTYLRLSELVPGTTRKGLSGMTLRWYNLGVSARFRVEGARLASLNDCTSFTRLDTCGSRRNTSGSILCRYSIQRRFPYMYSSAPMYGLM